MLLPKQDLTYKKFDLVYKLTDQTSFMQLSNHVAEAQYIKIFS